MPAEDFHPKVKNVVFLKKNMSFSSSQAFDWMQRNTCTLKKRGLKKKKKKSPICVSWLNASISVFSVVLKQ